MTAIEFNPQHLALTAAAIAGDTGTLYRVSSDLLEEGVGFDELLFDHLLRVEQDVGARWQQGDYLVAEEHTVSAAVETVISIFAGMLDQPSTGPRVVIAGVEGDQHSLPGRALAAFLLYSGYRTVFLGPNVLAEDFEEYLAEEQPDVVVLSCEMVTQLGGALDSVTASHRAGVPTIVGGRAFASDPERAKKIGAVAFSESFDGVVPAIESVVNTEPTLELAEPPPLFDQLRFAYPQLVAEIATRAVDMVEGIEQREALEDADLVVGSIGASVLVEDDSVLQETLEWRQVRAEATGVNVDHLSDVVDDVLTAELPAAADLFRRARSGG